MLVYNSSSIVLHNKQECQQQSYHRKYKGILAYVTARPPDPRQIVSNGTHIRLRPMTQQEIHRRLYARGEMALFTSAKKQQ